MRIAVVGAGIVGLTSAIAIKEAFPNAFVTIFSEDFSPNTTADGSAGLWGPFALGNSSTEKILYKIYHTSSENYFYDSSLRRIDILTVTLANGPEEHTNGWKRFGKAI